MKKLSVRKRCAIIIGAVLLAIYLIVSVIFWFTGMPKIFFRYKVKEDNTISIDYYSGFFPLLRIPDKIDGLPVTELDWRLNEYNGESYKDKKNYLAAVTVAVHIPDSVEILRTNAFNGFSRLTFVNIPSSLRSTENDVFANTNVYKLVFPEGITEIGVGYEENGLNYCSFGYMKHLRKVVFPESLKKIGNNAFAECPQLRKVTLPEGLEKIEFGAFQKSGLTEINIPKNLKKIGGCLFRETPFEKKLENKTDGDFIILNGDTIYKYIGKDENVIIPDNITSICDRAFQGSPIRSVTIPEGVKKVGGAFEFSGIEKIELPDTVEDDDLEFYYCIYLKDIRLPENTMKIRNRAFKECYSLENIVLPEGITEIGADAFALCTSLERIVIPESVTCIGSDAFEDCRNLKEVVIKGDPVIEENAFTGCGSLENKP